MSVCAAIFLKIYRKHNTHAINTPAVEILSSLRISARDIFFVIHCGPDVIAFTTGQGGTCLMGRWNYHEWLKSSHKVNSDSQDN